LWLNVTSGPSSGPPRGGLIARLLESRPKTYAQVVEVIERHVDDVHRRVLRSTTDPERGLSRFKKRAEQAQDELALDTLLRVLADVHPEVLTPDRLRSDSYAR
jgi:hypothetical protein